MKENLELKIEQYLGGEMSPEESFAFENEMSNDGVLYNEVLLAEDVNLFLKNRSVKDSKSVNEIKAQPSLSQKEEIKARISKAHTIYKAKNVRGSDTSNIVYYITGIAATVLILVSVYFFTLNDSSLDMYNAYYDMDDLPSFTMRSEEASLLATATMEFKDKEYAQALKKFKAYFSTAENIDPLVHIYTGLIYANQNQLDKSIAELDFLANSTSIDAGKAKWFKVMVYLRFDDKANAKITLKEILEKPNNYKYEEAKELLKNL